MRRAISLGSTLGVYSWGLLPLQCGQESCKVLLRQLLLGAEPLQRVAHGGRVGPHRALVLTRPRCRDTALGG